MALHFLNGSLITPKPIPVQTMIFDSVDAIESLCAFLSHALYLVLLVYILLTINISRYDSEFSFETLGIIHHTGKLQKTFLKNLK